MQTLLTNADVHHDDDTDVPLPSSESKLLRPDALPTSKDPLRIVLPLHPPQNRIMLFPKEHLPPIPLLRVRLVEVARFHPSVGSDVG